jgi:hypothetical protein
MIRNCAPEAPTGRSAGGARQLLPGYQVSRTLRAAEIWGLLESLEHGAKSADELAGSADGERVLGERGHSR